MGACVQSVERKLIYHKSGYLINIKEEKQKKIQNNLLDISLNKDFPTILFYNQSDLNNSSYLYENISQSNNKISKSKKLNLNIIYYDEHLRDSEENSDNCSFLEMNINGTFYGCHNFKLFKIVCEKLIKSKKEFILLSSSSCAEKIFNYCSNIEKKNKRIFHILFYKR